MMAISTNQERFRASGRCLIGLHMFLQNVIYNQMA